jgi:hypothetical protein
VNSSTGEADKVGAATENVGGWKAVAAVEESLGETVGLMIA